MFCDVVEGSQNRLEEREVVRMLRDRVVGGSKRPWTRFIGCTAL